MAKQREATPAAAAPAADGRPTLIEGMRLLARSNDIPDVTVRRVDIHFDAGGGATYRFWEVGEQHPGAGSVTG